MAFTVRALLEGKPPPVTATPDERAAAAVSRMMAQDYSELPVVQGAEVLGMISYESVLRAMVTFGCRLEQLSVRDTMFRHRAVTPDAGMADLLDGLGQCAALLVLDRGQLLGIVTDYDMTAHFRADAEDRMHLADVELALRLFVAGSYGGDDAPALHEAVRRGARKELRRPFAKALATFLGQDKLDHRRVQEVFEAHFVEPRAFDRLTLGDYVNLFNDSGRWQEHFAPVFGDKREEIHGLLGKVRDIRNDVAHLREVSPEQRELLRFCAEWLGRVQEAQERLAASPPAPEAAPLAPSPAAPVDPPPEAPVDPVSRGEGAYAPLAAWLQAVEPSKNEVTLPFAEVERILGGELPTSARRHRAWWANNTQGHLQAQAWLEVGWKATVNLTAEQVRFTRMDGREEQYIRFFSGFLTQLRARGMDAAASPHGGSFHWIMGMYEGTTRVGWLAVAFTRGGRFRAELYLDGGEQEANKRVFDKLYAARATIEQAMGTPLEWERLDEQRASRIARYRPGRVTDGPAALAELQGHAVEDVIALRTVLGAVLGAVLGGVAEADRSAG